MSMDWQPIETQRETNLAWLKREVADLESVIARAKEHIFDEEETDAVA